MHPQPTKTPFDRLTDRLRLYDPTGGALAPFVAAIAFLAAGIGMLAFSATFLFGIMAFSNSHQLNPVAVYGIATFSLLLVSIVVALIFVRPTRSSR
jgi:hypothetical protein